MSLEGALAEGGASNAAEFVKTCEARLAKLVASLGETKDLLELLHVQKLATFLLQQYTFSHNLLRSELCAWQPLSDTLDAWTARRTTADAMARLSQTTVQDRPPPAPTRLQTKVAATTPEPKGSVTKKKSSNKRSNKKGGKKSLSLRETLTTDSEDEEPMELSPQSAMREMQRQKALETQARWRDTIVANRSIPTINWGGKQ